MSREPLMYTVVYITLAGDAKTETFTSEAKAQARYDELVASRSTSHLKIDEIY